MNYDVHVMPYWRACDPCNVPYDFIGRTEDTEVDTAEVLRRIGIPDSLPEEKRHLNRY